MTVSTQTAASLADRTDLAVEARGLVKRFGDNRAVDGVDLAIPRGSIYGVLGPNGAGKTTTMRMLATLVRPDAGTARVFGRDVVAEAHRVRRLIGLTGQYASVDEALTAQENLVIFGRLLGLERRTAATRAEELLAAFALTDAAHRPVKGFSGGMRRRLDLAASLIARPPLIFLDEPTTGLDPQTRARMWETIRGLVRAGSTVVLTTQYLDEAEALADRVAVFARGRVVAEDTPDALKDTVGSTSLVLALASGADEDRARRILREILGAGAPGTAGSGRLVAPVPSLDRVTDVLLAFRHAQIPLQSMAVRKPTLDEVFLALTGGGPAGADGPAGGEEVGA
jgi:ABC-2 type transport system ATP-binding protein